ncbi:MAG: hypothetical protein LCH90_19280 [Proteobacteria bacterium]|nr:hypothetical protein [Pseudomonadota bacterium]
MSTEINIEELERYVNWPNLDEFLKRTNQDVNEWMKGYYINGPDHDFRLHCLWAWQENERRHIEVIKGLLGLLKKSEADLEREIMRLAACGSVALADTPESAAKAREMNAEYRSAACDEIARRVDECMALRAERDALAAKLAEPATTYDTDLLDQALQTVLGDAFDCTRVWNAWSYGTIGPDDFVLVAENDERIAEIREAVLAALPRAVAADHPVNQRLLEALDQANMALIGYLPGHRNSITDAAIEAARTASSSAKAIQKAAPLEPVTGDLLPPIGSTVLIHLNSQDAWVEHTVTGYYAWGDRSGNPRLQRVFMRVVSADGYLNARMLCDVKYPNGDYIISTSRPVAIQLLTEAEINAIWEAQFNKYGQMSDSDDWNMFANSVASEALKKNGLMEDK